MGRLDELGDAVRQTIRAFHGSPRQTHFDKFDARHIGSGEGAQAYAHGHYSAQLEEVARGYRDRLAPKRDLLVGGEPIPEVIDPLDRSPRARALRAIRQSSGADAEPMDALRQAYAIATDHPDKQHVARVIEALNDIKRRGIAFGPPKGTMYELEIQHSPDDLLDWDTPIANQPKMMERFGGLPDELIKDEVTGRSMYDFFKLMHGGPAGASHVMHKEFGIPGVKYLDQGSRFDGSFTHNYVVFPDAEDSIRILRKYAVPGVVGAGAASMSGGE